MSAAVMDPADQARALRIRAAIGRGASIHQHGQGVLSISVEGEAGMLIVNADEMRRVIPGWPRADEALVPGACR